MSQKPTATHHHSTYHHFHNHPRDDITLRSSDGLLFKASSHRLARASPVFLDMFEIAQPSSEPIDIYFPSRIIDMFLNSINSSEPIITREGHGDIDEGFQLLAMSRMFDCQVGRLRAFQCLNGRYRPANRFWYILAKASKINDIQLGREILQNMRLNRFKWLPSSQIDALDTVWKKSIMVGLFGPEYVTLSKMRPSRESPYGGSVWDPKLFVKEAICTERTFPQWIARFDPYRDHSHVEDKKSLDKAWSKVEEPQAKRRKTSQSCQAKEAPIEDMFTENIDTTGHT